MTCRRLSVTAALGVLTGLLVSLGALFSFVEVVELVLASATGAAVLAVALKALFGRARADLIDTGYAAPFYPLPSGHAAVALNGTRTLLVALRLRGFRRWWLSRAP